MVAFRYPQERVRFRVIRKFRIPDSDAFEDALSRSERRPQTSRKISRSSDSSDLAEVCSANRRRSLAELLNPNGR